MGEIIKIIKAISDGIKSPVKAGIGAAFALFFYFFILVQRGGFRTKKSDQEKDEQKDELNTELENSNAEAEASVRDRLANRS